MIKARRLKCMGFLFNILLFALIFYVDAGNNKFVAIPTGEVM
jgi:hypothetical protein